jgi:hypothetical protein
VKQTTHFICAEVMNEWSYISTPPYAFMAWGVVQYRIRLHGVALEKKILVP